MDEINILIYLLGKENFKVSKSRHNISVDKIHVTIELRDGVIVPT